MTVLIAIVLSVIAITEARYNPKLRVFEIVLDPVSEEVAKPPAFNGVDTEPEDLPSFRSDTDKLAMQLVSEIDMLLGSQNVSDSESQEHSVFDETRSLVLVPPDREHVYRIIRDRNPDVNRKVDRPMQSADWLSQSVPEDDSN